MTTREEFSPGINSLTETTEATFFGDNTGVKLMQRWRFKNQTGEEYIYLTPQQVEELINIYYKPKQEAKTAKEQFYEYGQELGIRRNDLQRLMLFAKEYVKQQYQQAIIEKLKAHIRPIVGLAEDYELGIEKAIEIIQSTK